MTFDRLFARPGRVVAAYALALPAALWLCARLPLDSDLLNLLPADLPTVKSVRKLQGWSGSLAFMYLGLIRDDRTSVEELKRFAEALGEGLSKSRWVQPGLSVGIDVTEIRKAAPLFLDGEDLEALGERLLRTVKAERKRKSGFFLDLDEDARLRIDDLLPKYRRRFQWREGALGGDPGVAILAHLRQQLNAEGTRLYYLSDDAKMLTFIFHPTFPPHELEHYPDLLRDIDSSVGAARAQVPGAQPVQLLAGGAYPLQWDQRDTTLRDVLRSSLWSAFFILAITFATVRRARAVALVFVSLLAGLAVTFALVQLIIGSVNVITAFLLAILAGLGIDFGYYFATRYALFARAGLSRAEAVREAWTQTVVPAAMGALTTMAVMVLLAFGGFRGFAELGIICSIGIAVTFAAMYTLLPALFLLLAAEGPRSSVSLEEARRLVVAPAQQGGPPPRLIRKAPAVVLAALALTCAFAWSARGVRFAYTGEELTVKGQKSLEIDRQILAHYGENVDQTVTLADTEERGRKIQQLFEERFGTFSTISRYESAFTYAPPLAQQQAAMEHLGPLREAIAKMPRKSEDPDKAFALAQLPGLANPEPITVERLPEHVKSAYLGRDDQGRIVGYLGHIVAKRWLWEVKELERFVEEIESLRVDGEPIELTGRPQIFLRVIQIVQREAKLFSVLGALLILGLFWIQARKLRFALLSMLPLFAGVVWTLGCLPFVGPRGLALSFMNLIVLPILTGLGVAYGVHVVYNYRLYGSAARSLRVTLRPVLGSAAATLTGWASLLFASMIGLQGIGWLATLGMLWTACISLLVLPALLDLLDRAGLIAPDRTGGALERTPVPLSRGAA